MAKVGVVGTTSWGTTLAVIIARQGHDVYLCARTAEEAERLKADGENARFVPGVTFPKTLCVTADPYEAFSGAVLAIFAVPAQTLRENARKVRDAVEADAVVVSATKGLEMATGKRMSEVLEEELPAGRQARIAALSGPNLASEIIDGKIASTVIASRCVAAAEEAQAIVNSPQFRVYTNGDIIGVEFGGAVKNVIALSAGICDGLQLGDNAKAANITRGLAEMARLGEAAGASPLTFAGLAGMGDLIATCSSTLSRNHYVGEQLASGKSLSDIRSSMTNVAEGVDTTLAVKAKADKMGVEMPITQAMYDVMFGGVAVKEAIAGLLGRLPRPE